MFHSLTKCEWLPKSIARIHPAIPIQTSANVTAMYRATERTPTIISSAKAAVRIVATSISSPLEGAVK